MSTSASASVLGALLLVLLPAGAAKVLAVLAMRCPGRLPSGAALGTGS